MKRTSSTRIFLGLFVASIVANAVLGIWALFSGDFGETQGKVLGSSFLVSAAMLSVLINIPAVRRRLLWPVPLVGAATGAFGFALFIVLVWAEPGSDFWFKLAGSSLVIAAGATLVSSLALIALPDRLRWLQPIGDALIAAMALTIIFGLWFEPDTDWYARLVGVEGVLVAAMTLLVPVLSRYAAPRPADDHGAIPADPAVRFCPSCGRPVPQHPLGSDLPSTCDACGLRFVALASPAQAADPGVADRGVAHPGVGQLIRR